MSGDYTFSFPPNGGTAGYVLGTDGSGNTSWINPSSTSVTAVTASPPLASSGGFNPNITISQSNATTDGYLSSADYSTFAAKQSTGLNNGMVWVGSVANVATPQFLNLTNIKSTIAGDWFQAGTCLPGTMLTYIAASDSVTCEPYTLTGTQVTTALSGIMSGAATISTDGTVSISNNAITAAQIAPGSVEWSADITSKPTTIAGYGITDAVLINAGGISTMEAQNDALRGAAGNAGRVFVSPDTQEVWYDTGATWVRVGSNAGLGGTVTNVTANAPLSSSGGVTPAISISRSNGTTDGYLASTDFSTFAAKLDNSLANGTIWVGNGANVPTSVTMSGDAAISNTGVLTLATVTTAGTYSKVTVNAKGLVTSATQINSADVTTALTYTPVNRAGDTMAGALNMGGQNITNTGAIEMGSNTNIQISNRAADPVGLLASDAGRVWFNTTTNELKYWNGSSVQTLGTIAGVVTGVNGLTGNVTLQTGTAGTDFNIVTASPNVTFNFPSASIVNRGLLTSSDWSTFNAKMNADLSNISGTLPIANGGTGATTATAALNNLLPAQAGNNGRFLRTDGAGNVAWTTAVTAVGVGAPLTVNNAVPATPLITMPQADAVTDGYIAATDWDRFDKKLTAVITAASTGQYIRFDGTDWVNTLMVSGDITTSLGYTPLRPSNNLSDVASASTARTNLGLGTGDSPTFTGLTVSGMGTTNLIKTTAGVITTATSTDITTLLGFTPATNALPQNQIFVGNASNVATAVAMSGDATIISDGTLTLAPVVAAGTVGGASSVPTITYDAKGRITGTSSQAYQDATGVTKGIVQVGANLQVSSGTISLQNATSGQTGALTSADWTTFNNKMSSDFSNVTGTLGIANGGTGATTAAAARTNLGLGTGDSPTFTGLTVSGLTDGFVRSTAGVLSTSASIDLTNSITGVLPVVNGGTGLSSAGSNGNVMYVTGGTFASGTPDTAGLVDKSSAQTITGVKSFGSNVVMTNQNQVRFSEQTGNGTNFVALQSPASLAGDVTFTLPNAAPTISGQVLAASTDGTMGWISTATGTVTVVTGTAPIVVTSSATTTPNITINRANGTTDGYLASTDFTNFSNRMSTDFSNVTGTLPIANGGTGATTATAALNNLLPAQAGNNGRFLRTDGAGNPSWSVAVTAVGVGAPLTVNNTIPATPLITMPQADAVTDGYIAATDWDRFDKKLTAVITAASTGQYIRFDGTDWVNTLMVSSDITTSLGYTPLRPSNNLSDVASASTARTNLGLGTGDSPTFTGLTVSGVNGNTLVKTNGTGVLSNATSADVTTLLGYTPLSPTLADGRIWVGNGSNVATAVEVSGDASIVNTGVLTLTPIVAAGTVGGASSVPTITYDAKGRITGTSSQAYQDATGVTKGIVQVGTNLQVLGGVISLQNATGALTGALTSADWTTFNNKMSSDFSNVTGTLGIANGGTGATTAVAARTNLGLGTGDSPTFTGLTVSGLTDGFVRSTAGVLSTSASIDLTNSITGVLPVVNGGTGLSSAGSNGNVMYVTGGTFASGTPDTAGLVDKASVQTITGAKSFSANVTMGSPAALFRLQDSGTNTVSQRAPTTVTSSYTVTWPAAAPAISGQVLAASTDGSMAWVSTATGTVTNVSANAPLSVATPTTTPVISISRANGATDGYLASTDFTNFSSRMSTDFSNVTGTLPIANGGTGATTATAALNNLLPAQAGNNGRFLRTDGAGNPSWSVAVTAVGVGAPLTVNNTIPATPLITMPQADGSTDGYLAGTDFTNFSNKMSSDFSNVTGTLGIANGGTGATTASAARTNLGLGTGDSPTFTGLTVSGMGTTNLIKTTAGVITTATSTDITTLLGFTPATNALPQNQIFVGNASNVATAVAMSGDATIISDGTLTLAPVVAAGTVGGASSVPTITYDAKGRITGTSSQAYQDATGVTKGIVQVGANLQVSSGTISLQNATGALTGALTSADWTTFNNKMSSDFSNVTGTLGIANGGTGATTAAAARTNLGLGTGDSPTFTGLTVSGVNGNTLVKTNGSGVLSNATSADVTALMGTVGDITAVNVGSGLTGGGTTGDVTISLGTELSGLSGLATNGFIRRTGAGTYSTAVSMDLTADVTGVLPVVNGGTGLSSAGSNGNVMYVTGGTFASGTPDTAGLVDKASVQTITGAKSFSANVTMGSPAALFRLQDSGTNTVSQRAPTTVTSSYTVTWPAAAPAISGQVLAASTDGTMGWVSTATGTVTSVTSANADIGVANTTTTPVLTLNSGLGANQIAKVGGSAISNNTVIVANGAGGLAGTALTNGQLLIGSTGLAPVAAGITGTANQITVTNGAGSITLSTPQDIHSGASPTFTGLTVSGVNGNTLVKTNGSGVLSNATSADVTALVGTIGDITAVNVGSGLTGGGTTGDVTISLGTELSGLSGLATNGFIQRTGAGTYATVTSIDLTNSVTGALPIVNGGTGATDAVTALNNLLPAQGPHAGKVLSSDGTNASWVAIPTAVSSVSANAPLSSTGGTTPTLSIARANGTTDGYLASTDWTTFNSKMSSDFSNATGTLGIANGGTGATTAAAARTSLGLGTGDSPTFTGLTVSGVNGNTLVKTNGSGVLSNATSADVTALVGTIGDITAVNVGSGLTGGGTTGDVTVSLGTELSGLSGLATNGFIQRTGAGTYATVTSIDLTNSVTGTLPVANGGTGAATIGAGNLVVGNGTAAVTSLAAGSSGNVVYATGVATWSSGSPDTAGLVDKSSVQAISGAKSFGSNVTMSSPAALFRLQDSGSNTVSLRAPATVGTSYTLTMPTAAPVSHGQVLASSTDGTMAWVTALTGTVGVGAGGTGLTSGTSGGIPYFNSGSTMASSGVLAANGVMLGGGAGAAPTTTAAGTPNQVLRVPAGGGAPVFGSIDLASASAVTGTLPVANGGTGAATLTANALLVGNGTSAVNFLAPTNGNVIYGSGGVWTSGTPSQAGVFANDGNSFSATATIGTNDVNSLNIETNNTTRVAVDTNGGVQVNGQMWSQVATSSAATPLTWNTNSSNIMRWTINTATITANIHNMKLGGAYQLVVSGTGTGTTTINCFSDAGVTSLPTGFVPANGNRVTGTRNKTVYTLMSDGESCLVNWITGF